MASFSLFGLYVFSLFFQTAAGLQPSAGHSVMFASQGDNVILPCAIPSSKSCSSIKWSYVEVLVSDKVVVRKGVETGSNGRKFSLLWNCSLQINNMTRDDARLYICKGETLYSNISLELLQITENRKSKEKIELHCFCSDFQGSVSRIQSKVNIEWSAEDNMPLNGSRFQTESSSQCFSKLYITKKLTDHQRKWRCHITENGAVKATATFQTTLEDGIEEVFAAVDESVSFSCGDASSYLPDGRVRWAADGEPLKAAEASTLVIGKVSALDSKNYYCSETGEKQKVLNKVRLHTLDVTLQQGPETNFTFTCVLTCAKECEKDFVISWCRNNHYGRHNGFVAVNNTLISELYVQALPAEMSCCATREGAVVTSKTWHSGKSLQNLAWLVLPLGLLACVATGGLYMYLKREPNQAADEQSRIEMEHVYDMIRDENKSKVRPPIQQKEEANDSTDSFYALLQAVN